MVKKVVLCLLVSGAALAADLPDDKIIDDGSRKLESGDVAGALADFARAEKLSPTDPRPHFLRAVALQRKGDFAAAEKGFRQALKLDPHRADVRNELGAMLTDRKQFREAVLELKLAVVENPKYPEAWYNLGQAYSNLNDCESVAAFQRATELNPTDADGFINLSANARTCQKLDVAKSSALHATQLKPSDGAAWWNLGKAELKLKQSSEAIGAFERAVKLGAGPAAQVDLGAAYAQAGDFAQAEKQLRGALAKQDLANAHWHLAQILAAQKRCVEAKKEIGALPPAEQSSEKSKHLLETCK